MRTVPGSGPAHSIFWFAHVQTSKYGLTWLLRLLTTSFDSGVGGAYSDRRCFATSIRIESFFAFEARPVNALPVLVLGLKMSV